MFRADEGSARVSVHDEALGRVADRSQHDRMHHPSRDSEHWSGADAGERRGLGSGDRDRGGRQSRGAGRVPCSPRGLWAPVLHRRVDVLHRLGGHGTRARDRGRTRAKAKRIRRRLSQSPARRLGSRQEQHRTLRAPSPNARPPTILRWGREQPSPEQHHPNEYGEGARSYQQTGGYPRLPRNPLTWVLCEPTLEVSYPSGWPPLGIEPRRAVEVRIQVQVQPPTRRRAPEGWSALYLFHYLARTRPRHRAGASI